MKEEKRPIFGIITTAIARRQHWKRRRSGYMPSAIWQALEQRASELGLTTCLFRPEDLDVRRGRVNGVVCVRSGETKVWRRITCPLPDVVYDNVFVHLSTTPALKRARRFFENRGTPVFNPRLGNKAELAAWLRNYPNLWNYHPETMLFTDPAQLEALLKSHQSVYLKPVLGSAGQGIIEIRTQEDGNYLVRAVKYGKDKRSFTRVLGTAGMLAFVRAERHRQRYILQAGCELLWIDKGKIDLRTHLQRNQQGEWEVVALIVKRGSPGSIVSNYHAGGSVHSWYWLKRWAKDNDFELPRRRELFQLSVAICNAYADKSPYLSSLGLDLGIDEVGKIWLLDVNARPGRNILEQEQKIRCTQLHAEFAYYLCYHRQ
ncbi:hypothetical protein CIG75_05480 [Tumebacillus algifaecis]|uniref:ATP-grasp domain-containing protein n=1 Tax=Tumebacillus algifaecis TaxID=1214604 RepID=A0A223CYL9_9BACL|nr:YheC/YheD family protein [Tumebacillus algifaecis]ASS74499.1 hypothetical protein CIG75_05480 [Tumebacillus algifaecis]